MKHRLKSWNVLLVIAAVLCAGAILVSVLDGRFAIERKYLLTAAVLAGLVIGAVRLLLKVVARKRPNDALEYAPEMNSLTFPPSSLRK
jgi:uncharacterized membrane protein